MMGVSKEEKVQESLFKHKIVKVLTSIVVLFVHHRFSSVLNAVSPC